MAQQAEAEDKKALGNEEFNNKNFAKAIEYYSQAIELDPDNYVYYSNRSAAYGALGKWEQAEADAKTCVERNPSFAKGYHRLANAQKQLGKHDDALSTLKAAQSSVPESAKVPGISKLYRELNKETTTPGTMGNRTLPPGVAKEFQELQPQLLSIQRELEQIDSKTIAYTKHQKRLALTEREIVELPQDVVTYRSVGKMFLRTTTHENVADLKSENSHVADQLSSLEARKTYLLRQKKSLEENITELLAQCSTK